MRTVIITQDEFEALEESILDESRFCDKVLLNKGILNLDILNRNAKIVLRFIATEVQKK